LLCIAEKEVFVVSQVFDAMLAAMERAGAVRLSSREVDALTRNEKWKVVDLCYQCKLCYVKCPYTPPHEFNVDFPRLMLRAKAVRARRGADPTGPHPGRSDGPRAARPVDGTARQLGERQKRCGARQKAVGIHRERCCRRSRRNVRRRNGPPG
jgi:hypothetical protein